MVPLSKTRSIVALNARVRPDTEIFPNWSINVYFSPKQLKRYEEDAEPTPIPSFWNDHCSGCDWCLWHCSCSASDSVVLDQATGFSTISGCCTARFRSACDIFEAIKTFCNRWYSVDLSLCHHRRTRTTRTHSINCCILLRKYINASSLLAKIPLSAFRTRHLCHYRCLAIRWQVFSAKIGSLAYQTKNAYLAGKFP